MEHASSEFHGSGQRDGTFLVCLSVMCLSALAIGSILLSWVIGGQDYVNSFYGKYAMAMLAALFAGSAYCFASAKKRRH